MYLWILTVVCTTVYGISRISQSELKAVNFAKVIVGYKLNGNVIREIEVDSERLCQFVCVDEERCLSYNFGPTNATNTTKKNAERFMCQLSNSDRFAGFANFTDDKEFIYKGRQVNLKFNLNTERSYKRQGKGLCWLFFAMVESQHNGSIIYKL